MKVKRKMRKWMIKLHVDNKQSNRKMIMQVNGSEDSCYDTCTTMKVSLVSNEIE